MFCRYSASVQIYSIFGPIGGINMLKPNDIDISFILHGDIS